MNRKSHIFDIIKIKDQNNLETNLHNLNNSK
jgi:hypothetical protein